MIRRSTHVQLNSSTIVVNGIIAVILTLALMLSTPLTSLAYASDDSKDGFVDNPILIQSDQVVFADVAMEDILEPLSEDPIEYGYGVSLLSIDSYEDVIELYGTYQYDTAAAEALYSFDSSEYAIIASGVSGVDALSATALAGALDCPILLASTNYLPDVTKNALIDLGVTKVIMVGGPVALTANVTDEIAEIVNSEPLRLWGAGIIDTQLAIYYYGLENSFWGSDCIVAQGIKSYADALSFSPIAYKLKAPIFLVDENGLLPQKSQDALAMGSATRALVGGGIAAVAEETISVVGGLIDTDNPSESVIRLGGPLLYDTSAIIATWAVNEGILSWNGAAFATGTTMTDSLAGSAVQARDNSVILLIDEGYYSTLDAIVSYKDQVNSIKFFGGEMVVTIETRNKVTDALGLSRSLLNTYTYEEIALTLANFSQMEVGYKVNSDGSKSSADDILEYLDPTRYDNTTSEFMEFVNIGAGYSGISAETIDAYIASRCIYREQYYSNLLGRTVTSNLRNIGSAVVEAAHTYNINEAYLLAHAIIESDWGCSFLAQGLVKDSNTSEWVDCGYLNFFGIGAFDNDPQNGASVGAYYGWDSPRTAMLGGAYWISKNYIHSGSISSGNQNTLWKMAWDATAAEKYGNMSYAHQYATSRSWAIGIACVMDSLYTKYMGRYFDFDELGITAIIPVFEK